MLAKGAQRKVCLSRPRQLVVGRIHGSRALTRRRAVLYCIRFVNTVLGLASAVNLLCLWPVCPESTCLVILSCPKFFLVGSSLTFCGFFQVLFLVDWLDWENFVVGHAARFCLGLRFTSPDHTPAARCPTSPKPATSSQWLRWELCKCARVW